MTRDEYIFVLRDKGLLHDGVVSGAISVNHVRDAHIRTKFKTMRPRMGYNVAVCKLADEYRITERRVREIVR